MANRKVELVDDTDEAEEAEEKLGSKDISEAVVYGTDWTVETILSQLRQKNIDMPPWQRRDAWTRQRKSRYIESLILGLPVPQIILAERKERRGTFLVLDGKQRLLSLLQFIGLAEESDNNKFMFKGLEVLKELNGKSYEALESDPNMGVTLDQFYNEPIRAVIVRNWPSESFLHLLFVRLNRESLPLSPQELRQALFPGEFVKYIDQASRDSGGIKELLGLEGPDRRMRDIEILVRYIAFAFFLPEHEGNLKNFLDFACKQLNKAWGTREEEIEAQMGKFELAVRTGISVFGEDGFGSRWDSEGGRFTGRLNKAILDVELFYFSDPKIARKASRRKEAVVEAFKKLWVESEEFRSSVESTTKSLGATSTRLSLWGSALKEALGLDFNIPKLKGRRIKFSGFW